MTAPPDAFNSGTDLVTLAPAGQPGDEVSVTWGIRALTAGDAPDGGQRSIRVRRSRTAALARSPSEPWIASTDMVVPSARSSDRPRRTRGEPDREHLRPGVDVPLVAVDHHQAVPVRDHPRAGQGVAHSGVQQAEEDQGGALEEGEAGPDRGVEAEPRDAQIATSMPPKKITASRTPSGRQVCGSTTGAPQMRQAWMSVSRIARAPRS